MDWLPWDHTFGGNHNFNLVLRNGGTLYIDPGRATPDGIVDTIDSLRGVAPTAAFNVPAGWSMLARALEDDQVLARQFFSQLDFMYYAAAALAPATWRKLRELAQHFGDRDVPFLTGYGATETAPLATLKNFPTPDTAVIGAPISGCEIKLAPVGDKLEARIRGACVSPGYWEDPDSDAKAFDEEGFFRLGDAIIFDPADPERTLRFDGRIAENFKLASGTWVHVGSLRVDVVNALHPLPVEIVVAGHDREEIGVLCFVDPAAAGAPVAELSILLRDRLAAFNAGSGGASRRIGRALLVDDPLSQDRGELTDKGYVNQRAVLANRAELVARLFDGGPDVIALGA